MRRDSLGYIQHVLTARERNIIDLKSKYLFGVRRLSYFVKIVNFPKKIESSQRNYYMQYDIVIMENTVYAHLCRVNTTKINVTVNT